MHLLSKEMLILFFILLLFVLEAQITHFFSSMSGKDGRPSDLAIRRLDL